MPTNNAFILTQAEVRNIRRYVQYKFSDLPQDKHADIIADAVRRIVFKRLPEFKDEIRRQLTSGLIRTALVERAGPVGTDDIAEACLTLELEDDALFEPFHAWVEQQLHATVHADALREALGGTGSNAANGDRPGWSLIAERLMKTAEPFEPMPEGQAVVLPFTRQESLGGNAASGAASDRASIHPSGRYRRWTIYASLSAVLVAATLMYGWSLARPPAVEPAASVAQAVPPPTKPSLNELPAMLQYREVNRKLLAQYLDSKNSLLSDAEYMEPIFDAAEQFDIDPILLFAITGQEQAFVPRNHKKAEQIINNPFNVFHSWQEYNTTIRKSAEIAARTIARLSKDRPAGTDPFLWINREYAEDPHWSDGVRSIWKSMTQYVH